MTLLEMVQNILTEMSSDNVNSIGDTDEALQVAQFIRDAYFDILESTTEYEFNKQYVRLQGLGDLTAPTKLLIPDTVVKIRNFKYNCRTADQDSDQWQTLFYQPPEEFMNMVKARGDNENDIITVDIGTGVEIFCYNNRAPVYYTSFDQNYIFCDAYDAGVDSTLHDSKTEVYAIMKMPWLLQDTFQPTMPYNLERTVLNEAKARSYLLLKGDVNPHAQSYAKGMKETSKFTAVKTHRPRRVVSYGRPGGGC